MGEAPRGQTTVQHWHSHYQVLLEACPDAVLVTDGTGRTTEVNLAAVRLFGQTRVELVGRMPAEVVHMSTDAQADVLAELAAGRRLAGDTRFTRPDGSEAVCEVTIDPVLTDGQLAGTVGICREVTEQRRLGAALATAEQQWRLTLDHAPVGIALVGLDGRFLRVNAALCRLVGYPEPELITRNFQEITHPDDLAADLELLDRLVAGHIPSYELEKRYFHADGRMVWISLSVGLVRDETGEPVHFVAHVADITERKAQTARLERLASHDPLTGLANRATFLDRLSQALEQAAGFAVGYLDLDGFKAVNDAYGHAAGDELLRQAAGRITGALRPVDVAARLGGDEFAVLLPEIATEVAAEAVGARLLAALAAGFRVETDPAGAVELRAGVSIGLSLARPADTGPDLLSRADAAMYQAKAAGTNRCILG